MGRQNEFKIQQALCQYIRTQYPDVIFRSDMGGIRLTIGQAKKMKSLQAGRAFPDLFICEPKVSREGRIYYGLFIEIKDAPIRRKNGNFVSDHVTEQNTMIDMLNLRGYLATFAVGFDDCREVVDGYLALKSP